MVKKEVRLAKKRHMKGVKRKYKLKERKVKISEQQVDIAMENIEKLENLRRIALKKFLSENNFFESINSSEEKATYYKKDNKKLTYILQKINIGEKTVEKLGDSLEKLAGLYGILEEKEKKKGLIFQINFLEKENKFKIVILVDSDKVDLNKNKKGENINVENVVKEIKKEQ